MPFHHHRYSAPARVSLPDRTWPERTLTHAPIWCSVDLRDGNQALPDPMGHDRKRRLLELLVASGFPEIELGFPSASQTDFDFIRWSIQSGVLGERVVPQVITQAREALIRRTFESIQGAKRAIVHLYNSTSELQRRVVFGMSRAEVIELAVRATRQIREEARALRGTHVTLEYSPESFTGTELDFAAEICNAVIETWAPTPEDKLIVNLPSTVENTTANVFADRIEWMSRQLTRKDSVILSVHTHNDRGAGVAAAELAMLAGAERVEGTLLGNGERSGNVDIVTLALNLYSHGIDPGLRFPDMKNVVRVVESCTRLSVHPRHPYAGELVFAAFSGSHQDAIHKGLKALPPEPDARWEVPYLPIDPRDIGRQYEPVIRINSQSGKSGLLHVLERDFGYRVPRELAVAFSKQVQAVTDAGGEELSPEGVLALFRRTYVDRPGHFALESASVERRAHGRECAVVAKLRAGTEQREVAGLGAGPVEAFARAVATLAPRAFDVVDFVEHARGEGVAAKAVAYVAVRGGAQSPNPGVRGDVLARAVANDSAAASIYGVAEHSDVVLASFHALISALNRLAAEIGATVSAESSPRSEEQTNMTTSKPKPDHAAPAKAEPAAPIRRRDATGHLDPDYEAKLRAETGHGQDKDDARAFISGTKTKDAFAEELGEDFVEIATSGEDDKEDVFNQSVPEDAGGPFVETSGKTEFAHGTDASNIKGATREPFPKT